MKVYCHPMVVLLEYKIIEVEGAWARDFVRELLVQGSISDRKFMVNMQKVKRYFFASILTNLESENRLCDTLFCCEGL